MEAQLIIEKVNKIIDTADRKQWNDCLSCFTEQVRVEENLQPGETPLVVNRRTLIAGWKDSFMDSDADNHVVSNHDIQIFGDKAFCRSQVKGLHIGKTPEESFTVVGNYLHELIYTREGWKVSAISYRPDHVERGTAQA